MLSSAVTTNVKRSVGVFPRLVSFPAEQITVLLFRKSATGGAEGVVVGSANTSFPVGEHSTAWQEASSIDLDGSVTLQNA